MVDKYIESLEKTKLLPYSFKRYGYLVLILSIPLALAIMWSVNWIWEIKNREAFWGDQDHVPVILNSIIAVGLSLIVFSKEKEEDEMVQALRFKSFVYGVYMFVMAVLLFPLLSTMTRAVSGISSIEKYLGGHAALNLLLFGIAMTFHVRMYLEKKRS